MFDLTRSLLRFSWAMSMLGVRQAANLLSPRDGLERTSQTFDSVSQTAADQLGKTFHGFYRAGDRFQNGLVDTVSRLGSSSWSEPGKAMNAVWEELDRTWTGVREELTAEEVVEVEEKL